jgi:large subunit ribosomal protein L3
MGGDQRTIMNLEVIEVDADRNLLLLGGAIPGAKGSVIVVREAVKANG